MSARSSRAKRIVVIASLTISLVNFRLQLLKAMTNRGYEVIAFGPEDDVETIETLREVGVRFERIPMARTGLNPFADAWTFLVLLWRLAWLRPHMVLPYTMKPIIYGGIAARALRIPRRFALITGLGQVFADHMAGGVPSFAKRISVILYRLALAGAARVFVYNDADRTDLEGLRLADPRVIFTVPGSGVDFAHYTRSPTPHPPFTFLLIARLLREKGILEFIAASRQLRTRYPDVRLQLLGPFDPHKSAITAAELEAWVEEGVVEYLGSTRDVRPFLADCTVFVLPSYYREGIPRTILEAMATGRAIITSDASGCRDTVIDGWNGFLVRPRDVASLAEAMEALIQDPSLATEMGNRSFELARQRFDVARVNELLLQEMGLIEKEAPTRIRG